MDKETRNAYRIFTKFPERRRDGLAFRYLETASSQVGRRLLKCRNRQICLTKKSGFRVERLRKPTHNSVSVAWSIS